MIYAIILIVWMHWFMDFIFQTNKMAINKSKSFMWLSIHAAVYTIPWIIFGWRFAIFNGLAHFVVDYFTSRVTSYLWKKGDRHNFFVVIGLDQAIHMTCLIGSWAVLK